MSREILAFGKNKILTVSLLFFQRKECSLANEVQIDLTSPTDSSPEPNAEDVIQRPSVINHRCCFICGSNLTEAFVKIHETITSHSKTPIHNYVNRFLDGKVSIRHKSFNEINSNGNLICSKCFNKINDYDLACVTATRLHHDLKWQLSKTEAIYASQKNAQKSTTESELIIGMPLDS